MRRTGWPAIGADCLCVRRPIPGFRQWISMPVRVVLAWCLCRVPTTRQPRELPAICLGGRLEVGATQAFPRLRWVACRGGRPTFGRPATTTPRDYSRSPRQRAPAPYATLSGSVNHRRQTLQRNAIRNSSSSGVRSKRDPSELSAALTGRPRRPGTAPPS